MRSKKQVPRVSAGDAYNYGIEDAARLVARSDLFCKDELKLKRQLVAAIRKLGERNAI